ncbi:MAG: hypothetical protein HKN39_08510 [Flavobacteriales bacterium]|nr:hypothetical protein [Flavobacteriales bacterium]
MHLEVEERERKKRAALMTLATGILLFILMWWTRGHTYMDPPLPEQGAIIEFGWDTEGSGETETETPAETEQVPTQTVSQPVPQETSQEVVEEVVTETESEVAAEKPTETQNPKETVEEVVKEDPKPSDQLNEAMTDMWNSNSGGGGDGEEDKKGNKGDPKGDKNSKGVLQNGVGAFGAGSDRYVGGSIKIAEKPIEAGEIVLDIYVDRYGNYLRSVYNMRESTSTSSYLINLSKKSAAKTSKFKADPSSPVEQKISVRFIYKLE